MLRSYLLVSIQFVLIGIVAWYGGVWGDTIANGFVLAGVLIGVAAIVTMKFRVSVLPEVREGQTLYTGGPYAFVRHPMYTAVLLATFGWVLNRPDAVSIVLWLMLVVDLRIKLGHEEGALLARFPDYANYMAQTKRLIPYIY